MSQSNLAWGKNADFKRRLLTDYDKAGDKYGITEKDKN